jgi:hypothetical protein
MKLNLSNLVSLHAIILYAFITVLLYMLDVSIFLLVSRYNKIMNLKLHHFLFSNATT